MSRAAVGRRVRAWLIDLYPDRWRSRYGQEYLAMLEQLPLSPRLVLDVVSSATAAHLDARWEPPRPVLLGRLRSGQRIVLMAWLTLVVAGTGFQKLTEDAAFTAAEAIHPLIGLAMALIIGGAVVSLTAILVGASPIALAIVRSSIVERRPTILLLLVAPLLLLGGWVLATLLLVATAPAPVGAVGRVALFAGWAGSFALAIALGGVAVSAAALRSAVPLACYRLAVRPSVVVVAAMVVVTLGVGLWGIALAVQAPVLFTGDAGLLATSTAASWIGILIVMAVASMIAGGSVVRIHRAVGRST